MNGAWIWLRAHWVWVGGACVLAAASYGVGRYSQPTKVEVREVVKTVEVIRWRDKEIVTQGPTRTRIVRTTVPGPAGPTVTVEKVVEVEKLVTVHTQGADTVRETEREVEKVVTRDPPRLTLAATIGAGFSTAGITAPTYGLLALGRVAGPLVVGAQAEGNLQGGSARAIVGLTW